VVYHIASFMIMREPTVWRWSHTRHHTDTLVVGRDPEIVAMRPPRLAKIIANFFGLVDVPVAFYHMVLHAGGRLTDEEKTFIPEMEQAKVFGIARIWLGLTLDHQGDIAMSWIEACAADDIEAEDVIRFDDAGRTFAIYRSPDDEYFATDGFCTHEQAHLADGLVMDNIIECPKHNGRFDYTTGQAKGAPVCVDLKTYPVKVEGGKVLIDLGG
jgi:3-phenylpropionate/trans-cinnamate dioxygenase ferredoxin subunit